MIFTISEKNFNLSEKFSSLRAPFVTLPFKNPNKKLIKFLLIIKKYLI